MRIVRALATYAAQYGGTQRRLLSVRFASDFVSRSARPGAVAVEAYNGGGPAHIAAARVYEMTESGELPPYTPPMP